MSSFLGSVWWMIVSLGVLVTFHEFGHYWVARRCGVRVLRFSVGFGKPLWLRRGRDGTEYAIAAIPLGGYVRMLDEREGDVPPEQAAEAFNNKHVLKRIAIVVAGPLANLLLCVALLWGMFVIGRPDYQPGVGQAQGLAAQAGLARGDTLLSVDGRATPTWTEAALAVATAAMDRRDFALQVRTADGAAADRRLPLSRLPPGASQDEAMQAVGLVPRFQLLPPVVGRVEPGTAAWGVLAEGDRITAIDGTPVSTYDQVGPLVQAVGGRTAMIEVDREGQRLALEVTPRRFQDPQDAARGSFWALGIVAAPAELPPYDATLRAGPLAAVPAAVREAWKLGKDSVAMIGRLVSGRASVENISGPITIARYANASAQLGPAWFLNFLALLSLSLAVINLLPIPVLDGGHLLYYLIELAKGSPLGERAMVAGQYAGLALLAGLMGLAFSNDILQLLR
ncbi:MAG: RIP metalloprotease RseP [Luteimonas sp.]